MPELPEVETIRNQLERVVKGQRVKKVKVRHKKSFRGGVKEVERKKIVGVKRRAKMLVVELEGGKSLLIHLKMTGQLVYEDEKGRTVGGHPTSDWMKQLPSKHTRVVFELDKGKLFFNDMRVFGWIKVVDKAGLEKEFKGLGPDVNSKEFTVKHLEKILSSSRRAVKLIIIDQKKLAGVGNIYANDGLYCAGIDPRKPGKEVAEDKAGVRRLFKCLKQVIERGIKYGGATASDDSFVDAEGLGGKYQKHFLVYEKEGEKCRRCGGKIKKVKLGGRGTYFCPRCQK